jgi:hypothetical protein
MRLSIRVVLCLLALSAVGGLGCRKALTPNIDRNEAPETWITAAPLDTLTILDKDKRPVGDPTKPAAPTTIPVRFHMYWAGSDKDGTVTGFYWAVVETTTAQTDGAVSLPGPKPGQYSFTTKTDTTFVFTVSELFPDRLHAFFIYAVDNQGSRSPASRFSCPELRSSSRTRWPSTRFRRTRYPPTAVWISAGVARSPSPGRP